MGTLSNFDLFDISEYYNLDLVDVVQKDLLNNCKFVDNGFYIINNQDSSEGNGTHWTALFLSKNISFFFDSFGCSPSVEIVKFVKRFKSKHLYYNNFIIQDLKSDNCGYYCIAFILFIERNKKGNYNNLLETIDEFINFFDDDTIRNDRILEALFRMYQNNSSNKQIQKLYKQN